MSEGLRGGKTEVAFAGKECPGTQSVTTIQLVTITHLFRNAQKCTENETCPDSQPDFPLQLQDFCKIFENYNNITAKPAVPRRFELQCL